MNAMKLLKKEVSSNIKKKEFLLSEILFELNENEKLDVKIIFLEKEIKEKGFSQTALSYSISDTANKGGKLGWVKETILNEKIYKELKDLNYNWR